MWNKLGQEKKSNNFAFSMSQFLDFIILSLNWIIMTYCVYVESTNFSSQQTKQKITNILSNCVCLKKAYYYY